ncbi:hypothetical protein CSA17_05195 [bacterium DOLJORAL78_65_58]|nr:MAG: hypothetical protein CSA17_05195 [bacterium DOLJORAL78_65_58]
MRSPTYAANTRAQHGCTEHMLLPFKMKGKDMKRCTILTCLAFTLVFALNAFAGDDPQLALDHNNVFHGGNADFAKDAGDTVFLIGPWGSGAQVNGQFEQSADGQNSNGLPAWNGWTSVDLTVDASGPHWHVSDYMGGLNGSLAAYCGDETFPPCATWDDAGGYGNNWDAVLQYSYAVADPTAPCSVSVTGLAFSNTEPGYDYVYFRYVTAEGAQNILVWDDVHEFETFTANYDYAPDQYVGANADEICFQIFVQTDIAYSDEDCQYPSDGAIRVDDLTITASNGGLNETEDFNDGELGNWLARPATGVGDFARLWLNLEDLDPCIDNYTAQVAFINDGTQVEGVPPSLCLNWCYGPGGCIVNTTGGASLDPAAHLYNAVLSPVLDWPAEPAYTGGHLAFGVYRHEDLTPDSPGMFYAWSVRSATAAEDITEAEWRDRNYVYYGGPAYSRASEEISDLLVPERARVQVRLAAYEFGWAFGYMGDDGTPAPYFDNVRLAAFHHAGPVMSAREVDLAQDNWPAGPFLDMNDLGNNSVRFDMARNNARPGDTHNTPGDSIVARVVPIRAGAELVSNRLVYRMRRNPVFDGFRDPEWGSTGSADAMPVLNSNGEPTPYVFAYDLPDSGFLFPGDVLHYYIEATDIVPGGPAQTNRLPADISGFADFSDPQAYHRSYTVRALPSLDPEGRTPDILFWNDFGSRGEDEWYTALNNLGLQAGVHYDVYYTNAPASGVGNGLGGRSKLGLLDLYNTLLYSCGDLGAMTLCDGDHAPGDDITLLSTWMDSGDKNAFFTGDNLVSDLAANNQTEFLSDYLSVMPVTADIHPEIGNQAAPVVRPVPGNSVFSETPAWIAYGGCPRLHTFDGVTLDIDAERLARFTDSSGAPGYGYCAATLNTEHSGCKIISMPYDFMSIRTDPANAPGNGLSARTNVLREVLGYFGLDDTTWHPTPVPAMGPFSVQNFPNPFNPATKIAFNMPRTGHLTLKIYNVRGELVKTLIDEQRPAGAGHIMWDGTNEMGGPVSSGIYFYEARADGEVRTHKMALIK